MILMRSVTRAVITAVVLSPGWLLAGPQTASASKLPLRAALVLSPDFCATKDKWNTFEIGKDACAQLEPALNGVFSHLIRVGSVPSSGEEQIVLVPRFVSLDWTNGSWAYSNRELVVLLEWTVKDMSGKTILLLAAQGSAKHQIGTAFSYKKNRKLLASDAVADAIANSVAKIAAALELRSFNSGSAAEQALLNPNSSGGTSRNENSGPGSGGVREPKVDPLQAGLFLAAARSGDPETVRGWLAANPQLIDARDVSGKTALQLAADSGHLSVVRALIERGADVNATDPLGMTALHMASASGWKEVVQLLLSGNAKVEPRSLEDLTPCDVADGRGHSDIVALLAQHGAKCPAPSDPSLIASINNIAVLPLVDVRRNQRVRVNLDAMRDDLQKRLKAKRYDIVNTTADGTPARWSMVVALTYLGANRSAFVTGILCDSQGVIRSPACRGSGSIVWIGMAAGQFAPLQAPLYGVAPMSGAGLTEATAASEANLFSLATGAAWKDAEYAALLSLVNELPSKPKRK